MFTLENADSPIKKPIKLALYGPPGTGKTHIALSFPDVIVVDTEAGTDFFRGRVPPFRVLKTKNYGQILELIDAIETGRITCETLVIDSLTVISDVLRESAARAAEQRAIKNRKDPDEYTMTPRDWGKLKTKLNSLMTRLYNLPVNTVLTGWIKDQYEGEGNELKRIGTTLDADKKVLYQPDVVLELGVSKKQWVAYVRKDRTGTWMIDERLTNVSYDTTFRPLVERQASVSISSTPMATEDEAAELGVSDFQRMPLAYGALKAVFAEKLLSDDEGFRLCAAKLKRPITAMEQMSIAEAAQLAQGMATVSADDLRSAVTRLAVTT